MLDAFPVPDYIYAFERGRNVVSAAQAHSDHKVVISLDIKDFFPSIKQKQVASMLETFGVTGKAGRTLSELVTYKAFVPQGAVTSPKVANLVAAQTFGPELNYLCAENGWTLTLYADDITISGDDISLNASDAVNAWRIIEEVTRIVERHGFRINREKTKVMADYRRQTVCGIVVNQGPHMAREERYRLKAILHNVHRNGWTTEASKTGKDAQEFRNHIVGRVGWLAQIDPERARPFKDRLEAIENSNSNT